jgi:hypothetical protein
MIYDVRDGLLIRRADSGTYFETDSRQLSQFDPIRIKAFNELNQNSRNREHPNIEFTYSISPSFPKFLVEYTNRELDEAAALWDSFIGKKIKVVEAVASSIGAANVTARHIRSEEVKEKFDFVVSRAVAELKELLAWSNGKIKKNQINALPNGLICLKGGDLDQELTGLRRDIEVYPLKDWFEEEFFMTKKLVYVPLV